MPNPSFDQNLDFMRATGAKEAQLVVQPLPPTVDEVETWKAGKNLGGYDVLLRDDGRIAQITWKRSVDHDLFLRWMKKRSA